MALICHREYYQYSHPLYRNLLFCFR